jgi:hypothetical protein
MTPFRLLLSNLALRFHELRQRSALADLYPYAARKKVITFQPSPEAQARSLRKRFSRAWTNGAEGTLTYRAKQRS